MNQMWIQGTAWRFWSHKKRGNCDTEVSLTINNKWNTGFKLCFLWWKSTISSQPLPSTLLSKLRPQNTKCALPENCLKLTFAIVPCFSGVCFYRWRLKRQKDNRAVNDIGMLVLSLSFKHNGYLHLPLPLSLSLCSVNKKDPRKQLI